MKEFNSDSHVEEWMVDNGGIDGLRQAVVRGAFGGQNKTLAVAWLQLHDRKQKEKTLEEERSLLERSVNAAERSAQSAHQSVKWAMWAAVVALLAVVIAVIQNRTP